MDDDGKRGKELMIGLHPELQARVPEIKVKCNEKEEGNGRET